MRSSENRNRFVLDAAAKRDQGDTNDHDRKGKMPGVSGAGTYDINTAGQAFSFSESFNAADTPVTTQSVSSGVIASPNLYGDSVTQLAGDKVLSLVHYHLLVFLL